MGARRVHQAACATSGLCWLDCSVRHPARAAHQAPRSREGTCGGCADCRCRQCKRQQTATGQRSAGPFCQLLCAPVYDAIHGCLPTLAVRGAPSMVEGSSIRCAAAGPSSVPPVSAKHALAEGCFVETHTTADSHCTNRASAVAYSASATRRRARECICCMCRECAAASRAATASGRAVSSQLPVAQAQR